MRYSIRRIGVGSTLRASLLLGWLVALCPALCIAGVAAQVLRRVSQSFGQIAPFDITILDRPVAHIDLLQQVGLSGTAQTVAQLAGNLTRTFVIFALLLTLAGAAVFVMIALLFSIGYNVLAGLVGGIEVELRRVEQGREEG